MGLELYPLHLYDVTLVAERYERNRTDDSVQFMKSSMTKNK